MSNDAEQWLRHYVTSQGGVAGTVHLRRGNELYLSAAFNIPPQVVEVVRIVPSGKGMAGLALERDAPVSTCDLASDDTGDVRPGAKAVDANAAVAIPIHDGDGSVRGVVGIAFMGARLLDEGELARLTARAEAMDIE